MTQEQILHEQTELIASFMKLPVTEDRLKFTGGYETVPRFYGFHISWEWLANIVEKIESLSYKFQICRRRVEIRVDNKEQQLVLHVKEDSKRESVYRGIVEFIEWYNLNH